MKNFVIALDQGTTSSRAIVFRRDGSVAASAQHEFPQIYPHPGWVEHNPMDILQSQFDSLREAVYSAGIDAAEIAGIGITNQRETTVVWDRVTGKPIYNAIVWQCRRTADICEKMAADGLELYIRNHTGLLIDPYFSATKIRWILDAVPGAQERAEKGELLFGTVESWLIWNLTGQHVTDYSNASRTMLFDIHTLAWDEEICRYLQIPMSMLPKPMENSNLFGYIKPGIPGLEHLDGIPVCGSAGDQQAALLGQGCISAGDAKNTYGTGCFTLINAGDEVPRGSSGLLNCVGWSINGKIVYVQEGSVFNAGSSIQWLRDELGLIKSAHECDILAESVDDTDGVYMVSAFTGLGAPWWDAYARGTIVGITRGTTKAHICRAVLEGIVYQVSDLLEAMQADTGNKPDVLCVDGGASVSNFMMQYQADILQIAVNRPETVETTALGAAFLAGLYAGVWKNLKDIKSLRRTDKVFYPTISGESSAQKMELWHKAVERSRQWCK